MCVGPGTFLWKGNNEVPVCLTLLRIKFLLTELENPRKGKQATAMAHLLAVSTAFTSNPLFTTTAQQPVFEMKKLRLRGVKNLLKLVRDRVCLTSV